MSISLRFWRGDIDFDSLTATQTLRGTLDKTEAMDISLPYASKNPFNAYEASSLLEKNKKEPNKTLAAHNG